MYPTPIPHIGDMLWRELILDPIGTGRHTEKTANLLLQRRELRIKDLDYLPSLQQDVPLRQAEQPQNLLRGRMLA